MIIILFRFRKEYISFLKCDLISGKFTIGDSEKRFLKSANSKGKKYNKVYDELQQIKTKYSPDLFAYQSPQKDFKGRIKDLEGYAITSILYLYCYQKDLKVLKLEPKKVKEILSPISKKELDTLIKDENKYIVNNYKIAKSNDNFSGLVFLSLIKNSL